MNKKSLLIIVSLVVLISLIGSFFIGYTENRLIYTIKNKIPISITNYVKKTILFPFYHNSQIEKLEKKNKSLLKRTNDLEDQINLLKNYLNNSNTIKDEEKILKLPTIGKSQLINTTKNNKYELKKYYFLSSKPWQYNGDKPVGYFEKYVDKIIILNGEGLIGFFKAKDLNKNELNFKIIQTSYQNVIPNDSAIYNKGRASFRGILIKNENIFLSYYKKVKDGCYNIGILKSKFNLSFMKFEDFFSYDECSMNMSNHSGGKLASYDENSFLFTVGDGQKPEEAQNNNSYFGKLYKINYNDATVELIAKGMRDTQGAYWYEKKNSLIMTEHGPTGGDEINILKKKDFNSVANFGWPIATYGKIGKTPIKENKYTVKDKNNHSSNGFNEPLHWYRGNSVAPSGIINVDGFKNDFNNDFFMATMGWKSAPGRKSVHHLRFDDKLEKLIYLDIIPIGERVRDLIYVEEENKVVLILENTPSIAVLQNN